MCIRDRTKPADTADVKSIASPMVAAGGRYTIALRYDGTVWAWGYNQNGELGPVSYTHLDVYKRQLSMQC